MRRDFFIWDAGSLRVRLALDVVDQINRLISESPADTRSEIGGVLLGRECASNSIEITGFEAIAPRNRRGSTFNLGERQRVQIARRSRRAAFFHRRPVGFFRTHLRPGLFLDPEDFVLMRQAFPDPSQIAVLIHPDGDGHASAGIFLRDGAKFDCRPEWLIPFDRESLLVDGRVASVGESRKPDFQVRVLARLRHPLTRTLAEWALATAGLVMGVALMIPHRTAADTREKPLNLRIVKREGGLRVDWDKDAGLMRRASSATLTIDDGGARQKIALSKAEMERGTVEYWPRTNNVAVEMQVTSGYETSVTLPATRTIIATAPAPRPAVAPVLPPPAKPIPAPSPTVAAVEHIAPISAPPPAPREPVSEPSPIHPSAARDLTPEKLSVPTPEPLRIQSSEPASVPAAPPAPIAKVDIPRVVPPPREPELPLFVPPPAPKAAAKRVSVGVRLEPKESSEIVRVASKVPLLGRMSFHATGGSDFSPPHPQQSIEPHVPPRMAADLAHELSVDVKVAIDKYGVVRNAEVLRGQGTQFAALAAQTASATLWRPAKQGDRLVDSNMIVHYRFVPDE